MATRFCLSKDVVGSGAFCALPPRARLLYVYLNMDADGDGVVANERPAMANAGASKKDLDALMDARFLLKAGRVLVIKHWWKNNVYKRDRYHQTAWLDDVNHLKLREDGVYTERDEPGYETFAEQAKRRLEGKENGTKTEPKRNQSGTRI